MAKKKLNKKAAIIGSIILAFFLFAAIVVVLRLSKDPMKFLSDAEVALAKAESDVQAALAKPEYTEEDVEQIEEDYKMVARFYGEARGCAKDEDLKIDILFKLAEFYLIHNEFREAEWRKAMGCWGGVIDINPKNIQARRKLLDYFYEACNYGGVRAWKEVETNASELLEVMKEKQMAVDTYILMAKGQAVLEMTRAGQTTDLDKSLEETTAILEEVRQLIPDNVDIYKYLAEVKIVGGEIGSTQGVANAMENAYSDAVSILQEGIEATGENPQAYVNLMNIKFEQVSGDKEKEEYLRDDVEGLMAKFSSSPEVYEIASRYYQADYKEIDRAIEAILKAIELDSENVDYSVDAAHLYYRKASVYKDDTSFTRLQDIANNALNFPYAQDAGGPRRMSNKNNRFRLLRLLSLSYMEQALDAGTNGNEAKKERSIKELERTVHGIEQIFGTGDNINVIKWQGMLELAKGNEAKAIPMMYSVYEQLKATENSDIFLSYALSHAFNDPSEIGAKMEFLQSSIADRPSIVIYKPEAFLEYAEMLLERHARMAALRAINTALQITDIYDDIFSANKRSQILRAKVYIGTGQLDEAKELLSQIELDEVETTALKISLLKGYINRILKAQRQEEAAKAKGEESSAEVYQEADLQGYRRERTKLVGKILDLDSSRVELTDIITSCNFYISEGGTVKAKALINKYASIFPDNLSVEIYRRELDEPDPINITEERIAEITEDVITGVDDEFIRTLAFGQYYQQQNLQDKALAAFKEAHELDPENKAAFYELFNNAVVIGEIELAEQLASKARSMNIDGCEGDVFAARVDIEKEDYKSAVNRIDNCLKLRPIYAYAYFLRALANRRLGNEEEAIGNSTRAFSINPLDGNVARQRASLLYDRNMRLGRNVSQEQVKETGAALVLAIKLNSNDPSIRSIYAQYIRDRQPEKAIAIRQRLTKQYPTVENYMMLGNMAFGLARKEVDNDRSKGFYQMAGSSYQEAYKMAPGDKAVLNAYSEFLRSTGQKEAAEKLFAGQQGGLWEFYLRDGQYGTASDILLKL